MVRVGLGVGGVKLGDTQAHSKMGCACASHFDIRMRISFWVCTYAALWSACEFVYLSKRETLARFSLNFALF